MKYSFSLDTDIIDTVLQIYELSRIDDHDLQVKRGPAAICYGNNTGIYISILPSFFSIFAMRLCDRGVPEFATDFSILHYMLLRRLGAQYISMNMDLLESSVNVSFSSSLQTQAKLIHKYISGVSQRRIDRSIVSENVLKNYKLIAAIPGIALEIEKFITASTRAFRYGVIVSPDYKSMRLFISSDSQIEIRLRCQVKVDSNNRVMFNDVSIDSFAILLLMMRRSFEAKSLVEIHANDDEYLCVTKIGNNMLYLIMKRLKAIQPVAISDSVACPDKLGKAYGNERILKCIDISDKTLIEMIGAIRPDDHRYFKSQGRIEYEYGDLVVHFYPSALRFYHGRVKYGSYTDIRYPNELEYYLIKKYAKIIGVYSDEVRFHGGNGTVSFPLLTQKEHDRR